MKRAFCYAPTKFDRHISQALSANPDFSSWTPEFIATLRGAYDNSLIEKGLLDKNATNPLWDLDIYATSKGEQFNNLQKVITTLGNYRNETKRERLRQIKHINDNKGEIWNTVAQNYPDLNVFFSRAHQLTLYSIQAVDNFTEDEYKGRTKNGKPGSRLSRKQVLEGIQKMRDGQPVMKNGVPLMRISTNQILTAVYGQFMADYNTRMNGNHTAQELEYYQQEYAKILDPKVWAALVIHSKAMLKNMEGLKMSFNNEEIEDASSDDFLGDTEISALFDPTEDTREGWQKWVECTSSYGSLAKELRRAISKIPVTYTDTKTGKVETKTDDLGYPVRMSALNVHQQLQDILRGCRSKSKMMSKIKKSEMTSLYDILNKSPKLQTQMYNQFRTISQLYMQINYTWNGIKSMILNKTNAERFISNYLFGIKYGNVGFSSSAYKSKNGWREPDIENIKYVLERFKSKKDYTDIWRVSANVQRATIRAAFDTFGIPCDDATLTKIMSKRKALATIIRNFEGIYTYGGVEDGSFATFSNFPTWIEGKSDTRINSNSKSNSSKSKKKSEVQEKLEKILTTIQECNSGLVYENKCRTINSKNQPVTYYGDVQPNFMGELIEDINFFADDSVERPEILRKNYKEFLKNKYFKSTQFCSSYDEKTGFPTSPDAISNFWIRTLWEEATADEYNKTASAADRRTDMFDSGSFTSEFGFVRVVAGKYFSNIVPFENFTTKQHYEQLLSSYFTFDTQGNNLFNDYIYSPVFVLGDSGVCKMLKTKRITKFSDYKESADKSKGKYTLDTTRIVDELYKLYQSELRRMVQFKEFIAQEKAKGREVNENILHNSENFTMLTFLNEVFKDEDPYKGVEKNDIKSGTVPYSHLSVADVKNAIREHLEKGFNNFLNKGIETKALTEFTEAGELTKSENSESDMTPEKNWESVRAIRQNGETKYVPVRERLKELYYNIYVSNLLQYQMFTGDLGFYKSVKDFQKRYKEIHAPGAAIDVEAIDEWNEGNLPVCPDGKETVKYFNDFLIDVEEANPDLAEVLVRTHAITDSIEITENGVTSTLTLEEAIKNGLTRKSTAIDKDIAQKEDDARNELLKKFLGYNYKIYNKFRKSSQTDGEAYRHINSYRKLMIMAGQWTDEKEAEFRTVQKINDRCLKENDNPTVDELKQIAQFQYECQPLKPYLFTMEEYKLNDRNDTMFIPVQHKYAEAILIPCLLPAGSKLRELAQYMEKDNIDLIASDACVKVGAWGQGKLKTEDSDDIATNFANAEKHYLNYKDYRIQSNVPEHVNVARALGTQVRKLIMGNMDMTTSKDYAYFKKLNPETGKMESIKIKITGKEENGLAQTGTNLISFYTSLIVANMMQSFDKFKRNIENEKVLSNLLTSAIVDNDRYSLHQLLDIAVNDGEFACPIYEGALEHDTSAMIFSLFRKEVNKQDMNGGSVVQVSDWGIETKEEVNSNNTRSLKFVTNKEKTNVLYAEIEIPFNFSYTDSSGKEIHLAYTDYCDTDGSFLLDEDGVTPKIVKEYPGILDIVAYRIPSERDYSILNCKVVRCTEPSAGGIIRVPAQGVVIAGFDFDIDKLYLIRKEFKMKKHLIENNYSNRNLHRIFSNIYEKNAKELDLSNKVNALSEKKRAADEYFKEHPEEDGEAYEFIDFLSRELLEFDDDYQMTLPNTLEELKTEIAESYELSGEVEMSPMMIRPLKEYFDDLGIDSEDISFNENAKYDIESALDYIFTPERYEALKAKYTEQGQKQYWNKEAYEEAEGELNMSLEENFSISSGNLRDLQEASKNKKVKESIYGILWDIREKSKEWKDVVVRQKSDVTKTKRIYKYPLNHYWNQMIEQNVYMEGNDAFDKSRLFEESAKELGLWKEDAYEEVLDEYDFNKGVTQNSRVSRNNVILELMRQRLMDQETIKDRLTPGGFDNSSKAALTMRVLEFAKVEDITNADGTISMQKVNSIVDKILNDELPDPEPNYDAADPTTLLYYNQLNQIAAKLIGIFANQNTNHQITSLVKKLDLVTPIIFDGMDGATLLASAEDLRGVSEEEIASKIGKTLLGKKILLSDGTVVDVDLNLAEFLAAAVDAVKDPVLNYLNFNTTTASVGALFARMGYSTGDIGILFNQPVIKELCTTLDNSASMRFNSVRDDLIEKYTKPGNRFFPREINTNLSSEELATQMINHRKAKQNGLDYVTSFEENNEEFRTVQLAALKLFSDAYKSSRELNQFINTTKFTAANAVGSSMGFFYNQKYSIDEYLNQDENNLKMVIYNKMHETGASMDKSLDNNIPEELLSDRTAYIEYQKGNPFAFEQCMYDLNKRLLKVLEKYYPYDKAIYKDRRDTLNSFLSSGVLTAEEIDSIHRDSGVHILASVEGSPFNPTAICSEDGDLTNRSYYLYKFPIILYDAYTRGELPEYIAKYLNFSYSDYTTEDGIGMGRQLHISVNLNIESEDKNTFTDAWSMLANESVSKQSIYTIKNQQRDRVLTAYNKLIEEGEYQIQKDTETLRLLQEENRPANRRSQVLAFNQDSSKDRLKDRIERSTRLMNERQARVDEIFNGAEVTEREEILYTRTTSRAIQSKEAPKAVRLKAYAQGLFFHNYYKLGFNTGPFSFMQFCPFEVKQLLNATDTMSYLDFLKIKNLDRLGMAGTSNSSLEFGYMYALNHTEDNRLVHRMGKKFNKSPLFRAGLKTVDSTTITLSTDDLEKASTLSSFIKNEVKKNNGDILGWEVYPVIKVAKNYYVAKVNGRLGYYAEVSNPTVTYERVSQLGSKGISNIYAKTFEEAQDIAKQRDSELSKSDTKAKISISENAKAEIQAIKENSEDASVNDNLNEAGILGQQQEEELDDGAGSTDYLTDDGLDTQALTKSLLTCGKATEDLLIETMTNIIIERQRAKGYEVDGDSVERNIKEAFSKEDARYFAEISAGLNVTKEDLANQLAEHRRQEIISQLVDALKTDIQNGKKEVYTQFKEKIC